MIGCCVALVLAALVLTSTGAPAQVVTVTPGDTVVSEMASGRIVAISPDNQVRELATGLSSPRGVAVLADGSILVAETGQNRIVGIGGRYGTGPPTEVASIPFPEGLTVNPAGEVYATALQTGEMGRVDLDAGTFTPIARGLEGPGDVAARGIAIFVTESGPDGRVVASVGADGQTAEFADGFERPIGLAFGPGSLFVADFLANRIVRVDTEGNTSTFAEVEGPAHLAIEPWIAAEGQPFTLSVTSAEGVVRFDSSGARIGVTDLTGTAGIATVPGTGPGGTPGPTVATTAPAPTTSAPTPTTGAEPTESAPATTRPPRTTTSLSEEEGAPSSTSGGILLASIVIIALIVVGGIVFAVVQRPKSGEKSGFEERPLDANTVALAFGSCAAEEVELAEAEGALASLEVQSESAEKRLTAAQDEVVDARAALVEARRVAGDAPASPPSAVRTAAPEPPTPTSSTGLSLDDLQLTTAAGRAALDAFLKREIEADELEEMWRALGEDRAIEVVRSARPGAEPATGDTEAGTTDAATTEASATDGEPEPVAGDESAPDDEVIEPEPLDEVALAEARLAEAEEDVTHAHAEIERLLERQAAARGRISAARAALDACQERHRTELDFEAAANADAATVAAASARTTGPPGPSTPSSAPPAEGADEPDDADDPDVPDEQDDPEGEAPDGPDGGSDPSPGQPPATAETLRPADVLPPIPERPPLTPDAATVAALRRPRQSDVAAEDDGPRGDLEPDEADVEPAVDAEEDRSAAAPAGSAAPGDDPSPSARPARRDGLDRGLYIDDHGGGPGTPRRASGTFPEPDPDDGPDPVRDPRRAADRLARTDADPEPTTAPDADPDPAGPGATGADPEPTRDAAPGADDPDPMAPRPAPRGAGYGDPSLSDVLFRAASDPAAPADPTSARLDDLVFAWPASGFQPLPTAESPEPDPEPDADRTDPATRSDDETPRSDLDFL